jgi:hypothetical protein
MAMFWIGLAVGLVIGAVGAGLWVWRATLAAMEELADEYEATH